MLPNRTVFLVFATFAIFATRKFYALGDFFRHLKMKKLGKVYVF